MSWKSLVIGIVLLGAGVLAGALIGSPRPNTATAEHAGTGAMCAEHGVLESVCTRCNPELIADFKTRGDWCAGHGVPESQCVLCDPSLADRGVVPPGMTASPRAGNDLEAGGKLLTDAQLPGLSVIYRTNQPLCPTDQASIQFASVETAKRAGIEVHPVVVAPIATRFEAPAEVVFDQNATTTLTSTIPISITHWLREPGAKVKKGDVIATAESPDMALIQGEHLEAWADWQIHNREKKRATELLSRGLLDSASYERAAAEVVSAEAQLIQSQSRLQLAGLADADLQELREGQGIASQFALRATLNGVLLERIAPLGIVLEPGLALARIGDPSGLWIEAQIRETDVSRIALGQAVEFAADGNALGRVSGTVIWISPFLDPHSRTATVRVKPAANADGLHAHGFGRVSIAETAPASVVLVPRDAVQWEGCCNVVFVREAPDRFSPHKVQVVRGDATHYRVIDGLTPGDEIVVKGSFLLKTELKKGSIGAGCCGLEASS